jgi:DNA repair exonuclease SbcCD nuclease subunit
MKVAVITDTHFGARGDNKAFSDYFYKFWTNTFFPYLIENDIKTIIHCGDLMDRRKYVNFDTLNNMRNKFIKPMMDNDITMHTIVGNHDTYYKNTVDVNSVEQLFDINGTSPIVAYSEAKTLELPDGYKVDMIPWINTDNEETIMEFIKNSKSSIAWGHFDLQGFEMMKGVSSMYHSRSTDFLKNYETVYSGHFHTKSDNGHIFYLGNTYEINWSDFNDNRGFHIFDTETLDCIQIVNPYKLHAKVYYDENEKETQLDEDYDGQIVKLIVTTKTDFAHFNLLVEKMERESETLTIVEDHGLLTTEQVEFDTEDTITTLNKYVEGMNIDNEEEVKRILNEIYVEAIAL